MALTTFNILKHKKKIFLFLICICGLNICTLSINSRRKTDFSESMASNIRIGMNYDEVVSVLSFPPGDYSNSATEVPYFSTASRSDMIWWEDDKHAIGVLFDANNKVISIRPEIRLVRKKRTILQEIGLFLGL